ncbi:hypothetical protein C7T94_17235 [Pedobacter yulinensis]|uniref:Uncharacterized protein n=1 Tax=Pedobacter yulinensis TaxID=2126353 RepID=A0A2T3HHL7_9SPHI|nr:hypothetical protein [Pedobacter yulinensis]PST81935.1 hypothetical protein C7T94_17235 [Pedobacter yulinensis]
MKKSFLLVVICLCCLGGFAQGVSINNFLIKESLLKNSKLAVIAADTAGNPLEKINGAYTFSVSGFTQVLRFQDGVALLPLPIERSTFVYIKHQNETGTHSKLVYVYKKDNNLNPFTISILWLVLIPLILVFLAFAFKRLIIVAIIVMLVFFYFSHSNGLNISTFFETIFDSLKNLF